MVTFIGRQQRHTTNPQPGEIFEIALRADLALGTVCKAKVGADINLFSYANSVIVIVSPEHEWMLGGCVVWSGIVQIHFPVMIHVQLQLDHVSNT